MVVGWLVGWSLACSKSLTTGKIDETHVNTSTSVLGHLLGSSALSLSLSREVECNKQRNALQLAALPTSLLIGSRAQNAR